MGIWGFGHLEKLRRDVVVRFMQRRKSIKGVKIVSLSCSAILHGLSLQNNPTGAEFRSNQQAASRFIGWEIAENKPLLQRRRWATLLRSLGHTWVCIWERWVDKYSSLGPNKQTIKPNLIFSLRINTKECLLLRLLREFEAAKMLKQYTATHTHGQTHTNTVEVHKQGRFQKGRPLRVGSIKAWPFRTVWSFWYEGWMKVCTIISVQTHLTFPWWHDSHPKLSISRIKELVMDRDVQTLHTNVGEDGATTGADLCPFGCKLSSLRYFILLDICVRCCHPLTASSTSG